MVDTKQIDEAFKIHGEIIDELGLMWSKLDIERLKRVREHIKKLKNWEPNENKTRI